MALELQGDRDLSFEDIGMVVGDIGHTELQALVGEEGDLAVLNPGRALFIENVEIHLAGIDEPHLVSSRGYNIRHDRDPFDGIASEWLNVRDHVAVISIDLSLSLIKLSQYVLVNLIASQDEKICPIVSSRGRASHPTIAQQSSDTVYGQSLRGARSYTLLNDAFPAWVSGARDASVATRLGRDRV
ncbi:MAG: hypothetical protein KME47_19600 [Nodosilinea sp. WJT8-NPBG4]|jgi:hypothetical protein|nr:hypothetical protein [Nodosilinea sp. WJT8-NPBG4]